MTTLTADQVLFEKAKRHIPGGVNSPVRAFAGVEYACIREPCQRCVYVRHRRA